jgi:glyoxylase-like metal-dependent hydrolase (beta-lactamase superfamily II)
MEMLSGIHRIHNSVSSVYLFEDPQSGLTIVDTGPGHFGRVVLSYLSQIGRRTDEVQRIILTHRHFDHVGGARGLRDATRAKVWAHPLDAPQIDGRERNRLPKGILGAIMGVVQPFAFPLEACPVDEELYDKQVIDLGALGPMQVIHTPGHTAGHCSLYLPSFKLLILGDALNNSGGHPRVPFDMVNDDTIQAHHTAISLASVDADMLVFGHGNPIMRDGQQHLRYAAEKSHAALAKSRQPIKA